MNKRLLVFGLIAIICALIYRFMPNYFYAQGKANYDKKNYEKAYEYFNKSHSIFKNNQDYRYYYVQTMLQLKPTKEIQQKVFEISTDKKNDSAHNSAERQVKRWKYSVMQNIGSNYIEQVPTDKKIIRWSNFPIKVAIVNNSGTEVPQYYKNEILRALSQWQNSTGFIRFNETNSGKDANIVIEIKKLPENVCQGNVCRFVLGFTTPEYSGKLLKKMNIVLYDKTPDGMFFSDKDLFNTVLHELGHALGIMGHSYNSEDLMYMSAENDDIYSQYKSSFQYLTDNDINTIKLLYKLIPDITDNENISTDNLIYAPIILGSDEEISNRKLKEAKNYIKNAPDLAGGYIDLGIAYSELGKTNEAINAMHKAYEKAKTDNEKYMALYNLSAIYFEAKMFDKAKEYALKAQQISDTDEVRNIILHLK